MDWIHELIFGAGIGHSILLLSFVIALGIFLGKQKICGISLDVAFVLFVGIFCGQIGLTIDKNLLDFMRDFGLILFVYAVGMQVGPGFFESLKKGGLSLNLLAAGTIFLAVAVTIILHFATKIPMPTLVGVMSGAVTNTPGLGAAQSALKEIGADAGTLNSMGMGYAVAYPLGVLGIIAAMILAKIGFKIAFERENAALENLGGNAEKSVVAGTLKIENPAVFGKTIAEMKSLLREHSFVISRHFSAGTQKISLAAPETILNRDDKIFIVVPASESATIFAFFGEEISMNPGDWDGGNEHFVARRIVLTKSEYNGKKLGALHLQQAFGVITTRITRAGVQLVADAGLRLQLGDRISVVGTESAIAAVEKFVGNSARRLDYPNLIAIFIGIAVGILLGSVPVSLPGVPQPFKLGLAGGPLIVAILIAKFGYKWKLVTYTTTSANMIIKEVGISIFLACVGLSAGNGFLQTICAGGYAWVGYGFLITMIPLLVAGFVGRRWMKLNYFTLCGVLAGAYTDPPALAYANALTPRDAPAIGYATVYPLSMFLRVLLAELLVLIFV